MRTISGLISTRRYTLPDRELAHNIVSRKEVARHCQESHSRWQASPGRKGRPHKDNPIRRFEDPDGPYLNKWEALGLGANVVA